MSRKAAPNPDLAYLGDKKLEKGRKRLIQDAQEWQGGNHHERREKERQEKEVKKKVLQRNAYRDGEKASWKKKAMGLAAIFCICGVGIFNFVSTVLGFVMGTGVVQLDISDTVRLKEVLFGGQPWLIYCVNNETAKQRLPKVLEDSLSSLWSSHSLQVGILSCWDRTSSGRSVAQRFKMRQTPPLAFVTANGNKPRIVGFTGVQRPEDLERKVKPALTLDTHKIDTLKKWPTYCTSRRTCVVVGHRHTAERETALNVLRPLQTKHRAVKIVTLDTSFWELKLDEGVLQTRPPKQQGGAAILCLARDEMDGNATYSGRFLHGLDAGSATSFITACDQRADLVRIGLKPRIKARSSKPKKVKAKPPPRPKTPPPTPPKKPQRANVDHVGSRSKMESEDEALFEAVEEGEDGEEDAGEGDAGEEEQDDDEDAEEVEL